MDQLSLNAFHVLGSTRLPSSSQASSTRQPIFLSPPLPVLWARPRRFERRNSTCCTRRWCRTAWSHSKIQGFTHGRGNICRARPTRIVFWFRQVWEGTSGACFRPPVLKCAARGLWQRLTGCPALGGAGPARQRPLTLEPGRPRSLLEEQQEQRQQPAVFQVGEVLRRLDQVLGRVSRSSTPTLNFSPFVRELPTPLQKNVSLTPRA